MYTDQPTAADTAQMHLLSLLQERDMYGFEIITELNNRADSLFHGSEGLLYPLLHTMEKDRFVKSYTKTTPEGHTRRYYQITPTGRKILSKHAGGKG